MQGAISATPDSDRKGKGRVHRGNNAFEQLWQEVNKTMSEVWNSNTFADLVEFERNSKAVRVPNYVI
jgi:DNA-binding IscR family transcriptional regulator